MILDDLVSATQKRIAKERTVTPLKQLRELTEQIPNKNPQVIVDKFLEPQLHFIGEIKKA